MRKKYLFGIAVVALLFSFMLLGCPEPEEEFSEISKYTNGHSYQIIDISMSWTDAKSYCENQGGYLVTITSAGEQEFIEKFLIARGDKSVYWLGGYRDSDNSFKWVTAEHFNYTNWAPGEPNGSYGREDKIQLADFLNGCWNDGENAYNPSDDIKWSDLGFICEWDSLE